MGEINLNSRPNVEFSIYGAKLQPHSPVPITN